MLAENVAWMVLEVARVAHLALGRGEQPVYAAVAETRQVPASLSSHRSGLLVHSISREEASRFQQPRSAGPGILNRCDMR